MDQRNVMGSRRIGRSLHLVPHRFIPRARFVPEGRTLHLVDIENLMGGPFASRSAMADVVLAYRQAAGIQPMDHLVVAVNENRVVDTACVMPGALIKIGHGPNGADLALLREVRDVRWIAARFDRVVIGSGDGIFEAVTAALCALGIAVGVVARQHSIAFRLLKRATFVRILPIQSNSQEAA